MKKIMTLAIAAIFVSTASAATLTWGYGSGYLFVADNGATTAAQAADYTGTVDSNAKFVLLYLGSSSTMDLTKVGKEGGPTVVDNIAYGFSKDDYNDSYATTQSRDYTPSQTGYFGIAFFDGENYSALYSVTDYSTGAIGGALSPVVQITDTSALALPVSLFGSDGGPMDEYDVHMAGVYGKSASTPVIPEPGVACMALLGIGMMLKRRRA